MHEPHIPIFHEPELSLLRHMPGKILVGQCVNKMPTLPVWLLRMRKRLKLYKMQLHELFQVGQYPKQRHSTMQASTWVL